MKLSRFVLPLLAALTLSAQSAPAPIAASPVVTLNGVIDQVHIARSGGKLAIDAVIGQPTEAYRHRAPVDRKKTLIERGGNQGTEIAVERGLDFFARIQFPDGHWSLHELPPGCPFAGRCAHAVPACAQVRPAVQPLDAAGAHWVRCDRPEALGAAAPHTRPGVPA